jgi:pyrimidine-specific ribonucleoside hydrolase
VRPPRPAHLLLALLPLLALLAAPAPLRAHGLRTPVIVDVDLAFDDLRALALLLASPHADVRAIVVSDGSVAPDVGLANLRRVLRALCREDLPVGVGPALGRPAPEWGGLAATLGGAAAADLDERPAACPPLSAAGDGAAPGPEAGGAADAVDVVAAAVRDAPPGVLYLALGPLTNLARFQEREPALAAHVAAVLFQGAPPGAEPVDGEPFNTAFDRAAAAAVFGRTPAIVVFPEPLLPPFDDALLAALAALGSPGARLLRLTHGGPALAELRRTGHLRAWDDTVALFVEDPTLFRLGPLAGHPGVVAPVACDAEAGRGRALDLLARLPGEAAPRETVVLAGWPLDPASLQADVRPVAPAILARHGVEEWKATLLTNELHRHLGIWSIVGAKMGIRARELLGATLDELTVETEAGRAPPLSCLNDGLQVATGASLGRGTISVAVTVAPAPPARPRATFTLRGTRLRLTVRPAVVARIRADVEAAVARHGELTPAYFQEIRRLSLTSWLELDRRAIFEEERLPPEGAPPQG